MPIEQQQAVRVIRITGVDGLDPVTAVFIDLEPGKGKLMVECFGCAWSAYWNAMGARNVVQFVTASDPDYLANSLVRGMNQFVSNKRAGTAMERYVQRIAAAV
ncbi:MAG TPA: hypothetical protein VGE69_13755, partial [Pseudomonadales bacterium]